MKQQRDFLTDAYLGAEIQKLLNAINLVAESPLQPRQLALALPESQRYTTGVMADLAAKRAALYAKALASQRSA